jgi:hypothetical protein
VASRARRIEGPAPAKSLALGIAVHNFCEFPSELCFPFDAPVFVSNPAQGVGPRVQDVERWIEEQHFDTFLSFAWCRPIKGTANPAPRFFRKQLIDWDAC